MLTGRVGILKVLLEKGGAAILGCSDWRGAEGLEFTCSLHSCSRSGGLRAAGCTHLGLESFTGGVFIDSWCWLRGSGCVRAAFPFPDVLIEPSWSQPGRDPAQSSSDPRARELWVPLAVAARERGHGCSPQPSCHCLGASVPSFTLRQIGINSI